MAITIPAQGSQSDSQRALTAASLSLERAVSRLSSGLRINSAGDDAAGLAVSEVVKAKMRSRQQALRNIGDGLSALQTADGGMVQIGEMLIRMRELALQSANGSYSDEDRQMLQLEVDHLIEGIEESTIRCKFKDEYLLRGRFVDVAFLIDASGSMGGEIAQVKASIDSFYQSFADAGISVEFGLIETVQDTTDHANLLANIGDESFQSELSSMGLISVTQDPYSTLYNATGLNNTTGTIEPDLLEFRSNSLKRIIYITDTNRETSDAGIDPSETNLANALAAADFTVDFICDTTKSADFDEIATTTGGSIYSLGNTNGSNIPTALADIAAQVRYEIGGGAEPMVIQAGPSEQERVEISVPVDMTPRSLGIAEVDISTQEGALNALDRIDQAMDNLARGRAGVGASANALEHALDVQNHELQADTETKMRITDADVAEEATTLARSQILAQSANAMTAQINQIRSSQVLSLVQNSTS